MAINLHLKIVVAMHNHGFQMRTETSSRAGGDSTAISGISTTDRVFITLEFVNTTPKRTQG